MKVPDEEWSEEDMPHVAVLMAILGVVGLVVVWILWMMQI